MNEIHIIVIPYDNVWYEILGYYLGFFCCNNHFKLYDIITIEV
jgi:hypothetical protein